MRLLTTVMMISVCALSLAAQVSPSPADVLGYRTTRWGMTTDEVLTAMPGEIEPIAPPKDGVDGFYIAGAPKRISVAGVSLNLGMKVGRRTMRLIEVNMATDKAGPEEFVTLENALSMKFGTPTNKQSSLTMRETVWVFKTTTIRLKYIVMTAFDMVDRLTTITYFPSVKPDISNL